ncbi:unnamed protein product [Mycena citricolor]|uniref:Uncharacterized protein n=1 Tax=Mycena citricolor TaxID=2018698 RepID=A0AAD2H0J5_9AGAR|nr:unnamed protein product [Mycena citricolor]
MRVETLRRQLVLVLAAAPRSDVSLYMALWSGHRLGASADAFGWHAQLPDDTGRRRVAGRRCRCCIRGLSAASLHTRHDRSCSSSCPSSCCWVLILRGSANV